MKTLILFLLMTGSSFMLLSGQTTIRGTVTDQNNHPLPGANIFIKGTYDGCTSDTAGQFMLKTNITGTQTLIFRYIGYHDYIVSVTPEGKEIILNVKMSVKASAIDGAVITAGMFEAGDRKKAVMLNPIDIVTVPSSEGDIYGALNTLPGTQTVGEEGKIFVRGGESYETKTYMDGILVNKPYSSRMPDVPARGRFSPFLFSGTVFSTGGYSAEYGQALSSVLSLNTSGLPDKSTTGVSLMSVGGSLSHTRRWDRTSLELSGDYTNLQPYFQLVPQDRNWIKAPQNESGTIIFRQKAGRDGLFKVFGNYTHAASKLFYPDYQAGTNDSIGLFNDNNYLKTSYAGSLSDNLMLKAGGSFNNDIETIHINNDVVTTHDRMWQYKIGLVHTIADNLRLIQGIDLLHENYNQQYAAENQPGRNMNFVNDQPAVYAEAEMNITYRLACRAGLRFEYSSLLKQSVLSPRVALAYKSSDHGQFSFAWGRYSQLPQPDYLKFTSGLKQEEAIHYILNYQFEKDNRTFRVETYFKDYKRLIKYSFLNNPDPLAYNNNGKGYARGIDIYWRDRETIKYADYWISYSYIDTKRNYRDYPQMATPYFISNHNLSIVYKQWVSKLNTQLGLAYKFASGRPYTDPNSDGFLEQRTHVYNDLSLNISYLTSLLGQYTVVHFAVNNLLGFNNVYGYHYESVPSEDGSWQPHAIIPEAKRFWLLVLMVSID